VVLLVLAFAGPVLRWLLALLALARLPVLRAVAFFRPAFDVPEAPCILERVDIHLVQMNALTRQRIDMNACGVCS
jgi:hypothetical protein